jgi:hypothetical protein
MSKRTFLNFFVSLFSLFFFSSFNTVSAQTCTCTVNIVSNACVISSACPSGYTSHCIGIGLCNGGPSSCSCSPNGGSPPATCGGQGQPCCAGNTCNLVGGDCVFGTCTTVGVTIGAPLTPGWHTGDTISGEESCNSGKGIDTAIGCIPISSQGSIATFFLGWGMGIGGGIGFVLIVVSSFMIMTSAGDPRKLQAGKELLTGAISGILLLVFSAYILRVVGVDILKLPGF